MHKSTNPVLTTSFLFFAAAGTLYAPTVGAQDQSTDKQFSGLLEEVIVTAQKRQEILSEIPMSITVLSGDSLERQNALNFKDMVSMVPGLSITSSRPGNTRITLRGINTGGVASTVGVYLDEVPFGSSSGLANGAVLAGEFDTFDMARIEVLRGPQGTLYGASSLGGVFKYVPNRPSTDGYEARFKGGLETVEDGDMGYSATGVVNVPVSESFAIRASGFYRSDDGFVDSIGNHPVAALQDPTQNVIEGTQVREDLNSKDTKGGRLSALFEPSEKFSLNLMALMQDIDTDSTDQIDVDPDTLAPLDSHPVQSRYQDAFSDFSYRVYSATIDWDFGPASLQSITSQGEFEQNFQLDAAIASALTGGLPLSSLLTFLFDDPTTPEIAPKLSSILPQITSTDKFTQEFRLLSPESDVLDWLVGLYYTDEDSVIDQTILAVDAGTENLTAGFPPLAIAQLLSNYEETAVFGNATWYVSPTFELSFGARYSDNDQSVTQFTDGPLAGGAPATLEARSSESPFTWSISPRWELNDRSSTYFRVATGFRPGGPNIVPPAAPPGTPASYDSDELTSYEWGYRTTSEDGRFGFDITAFFLDWEDIQLIASLEGFNFNANGGTAESKGLEFAASYVPNDNLGLSFHGAYTDAELTQDTGEPVGGLDGDPLPFVPEWSFGVSADYEWAVLANSTAYTGATFGYTGDRPGTFGDTDNSGRVLELDSYTTIDLRAGLETGHWLFELYVKNLTDELGQTSLDTSDAAATGWAEMGIIRPRTIGISASVSY